MISDSQSELSRRVKGYGGVYAVYRDGEVYNVLTNRWLHPAPSKTRGGRLKVSLYRYGVRRTFWVARLVAEVFLGPCPGPGYEADHLDGNVLNNHVSNLEWVLKRENIRRAAERGVYAKKLTKQLIRWIMRKHDGGRSTKRLAYEVGVSQRTIQKVVSGRAWAWVDC